MPFGILSQGRRQQTVYSEPRHVRHVFEFINPPTLDSNSVPHINCMVSGTQKGEKIVGKITKMLQIDPLEDKDLAIEILKEAKEAKIPNISNIEDLKKKLPNEKNIYLAYFNLGSGSEIRQVAGIINDLNFIKEDNKYKIVDNTFMYNFDAAAQNSTCPPCPTCPPPAAPDANSAVLGVPAATDASGGYRRRSKSRSKARSRHARKSIRKRRRKSRKY